MSRKGMFKGTITVAVFGALIGIVLGLAAEALVSQFVGTASGDFVGMFSGLTDGYLGLKADGLGTDSMLGRLAILASTGAILLLIVYLCKDLLNVLIKRNYLDTSLYSAGFAVLIITGNIYGYLMGYFKDFTILSFANPTEMVIYVSLLLIIVLVCYTVFIWKRDNYKVFFNRGGFVVVNVDRDSKRIHMVFPIYDYAIYLVKLMQTDPKYLNLLDIEYFNPTYHKPFYFDMSKSLDRLSNEGYAPAIWDSDVPVIEDLGRKIVITLDKL